MLKCIASAVFALALAALPACESEQHAPRAQSRALDNAYVGSWRMESGQTVTISRTGDFSFTVSNGGRVEHGEILDVDGAQFCAIRVYEPTPDDSRKGGLPLYHYGQLKVEGDTLVHRPLSAAWLSKYAYDKPSHWVATDQVMKGTGVAVMPDSASMNGILRKAMRDPTAFGDTEKLTRVR